MEIVKSIQATLQERVVSPLGGVFMMSWAVMHYELVMMMLSDLDMINKVALVKQHLVIDAKDGWRESWSWFAPYFYGIWLPLAVGFVVLIGYSVFSVLAFRVSIWAKVKLRNIKKIKEGEVLVTRTEYDQAIDAFQLKNDDFREREIRLESDGERLKKLYQQSLDDLAILKEEQQKLKQLIAEVEGEKEKLEAIPQLDVSKHFQHDEVATGEPDELFKNGGGFAPEVPEVILPVAAKFSGTFQELIFDSQNSKLNQLVLELAARVKGVFTAKDFLLHIGKPESKGNDLMANSILDKLVRYHLLRKTVDGFIITQAGKTLTSYIQDGNGTEFCKKLDGKVLSDEEIEGVI